MSKFQQFSEARTKTRIDENSEFFPTLHSEGRYSRISMTNSFRLKKLSNKSLFNNSNPSSIFHKDDEYLEIKGLVDSSREEITIDKESKPLIGNEAIRKYYKHLKMLDRVQEENTYKEYPPSVYTLMQRSSTEHLILPCKLGLLKYDGQPDIIKINHMKYGDHYINVLKEGIRKTTNIEVFELSDNRITNQTSGLLISALGKNAKELNLSHNKIGNIGVQHISATLKQKECRIEILDIEDNQLGNQLIQQLCIALLNNKTIQKLNLSKNFITNTSCNAIAQLILENSTIKELYLYWNQIKAEGASLIFQALQNNQSIKVLDLSQNSLGSGVTLPMCNAFTELIQKTELIHLDLSFNNIGLKETQIIADSLSKNRTIYGFHFIGNQGYVDSKGFLIPIEQAQEDQGQSHVAMRIRGVSYVNQMRLRSDRDKVLKDCCWICEGWNQKQIAWVPQVSGDGDIDPLFIHFNFQDYCGIYLGKPDAGLKTLRMFPPGQIKYFYTTGLIQQIAMDQLIIPTPISINNVLFPYTDQPIQVQLESINEDFIEYNSNIFDQYYEPLISVLPRTKDLVYIPPKQKKNKIIWTFPISLFKDWRKDTDDIINQCFEIDWGMNRAVKKFKTQEDHEQTKAYMKIIYPYFKDTYRYYSSFNPIGEVWCVQAGVFGSLLTTCKICDVIESNPRHSIKDLNETIQNDVSVEIDLMKSRSSKAIIKQQNCDIKFTETLAGLEKGNPRRPDRGMVRYQFMEVWMRIAEEKYVKNGVCTTMLEAMKYIWEDCLKNDFITHSSKQWREERYWNEQCDYCLKNYKQIMDHIYSKFARKNVKPGQKPFMCLQELIDIFTLSGLLQYDHIGSQVPFIAYNQAMMTQKDELTIDRIFQMNFVEFLEAFCRIADEASLLPISGAFPEGADLSLPKLKELPLHYKIESFIILCLDTCCDAGFKANYKKPEKSFFTPVIEEDEESS